MVLLLAAGLSLRLAGQTIDTIIIENGNVFDGSDGDGAPAWMARLANTLHLLTRQWVIRRS